MGAENLSKPVIQTAIAERRKIIEQETGVTPERIVKALALIAFADPADVFDEYGQPIPIQKLDRETSVTLARYDVLKKQTANGLLSRFRIRWHDKIAALNLLGRHLGMFDKNRVIAVSGGDPVQQLFDDIAGSGNSRPQDKIQ
jgi:phage terminase small subunit